MRSYVSIGIAFLIWSSWVIPVRSLGYNAYTLVFFSSIFAAFLWGVFNIIKKKKIRFGSKKEKIGLLALSSFFVANLITYLLSLKLTTASIAVLTHYSAPIFVAILAPYFLNEKITKITFLAMVTAIFGFVIIMLNSNFNKYNSNLGALLGLASGFFYGLSIILARLLLKNLESETIIFSQNLFSGLFLLIFFKNISFNINLDFLLKMIALAFFYSVVASYLYLYGLKKLGGIRTSIIGYIEPFGTVIWGWLIFNEKITFHILIGGFLILLSGYMVSRNDAIFNSKEI